MQNTQNKPKLCKLVFLPPIIFIAGILSCLCLITNPRILILPFFIGSIITSLVIAFIANYKIRKSNGNLKGKFINYLGVIIVLSLLSYIYMLPRISICPRKPAEPAICASNLVHLGKAMKIYLTDNNNTIPNSNWCDTMVIYCDVELKGFICPSNNVILGESSYAMNENAVGKKLSQLPADMVLFFETGQGLNETERDFDVTQRPFYDKMDEYAKSRNKFRHKKVHKNRWNQTGGPDDLFFAHGIKTNMLFIDGSVRTITKDDLPNLIWKPEDYNDVNDI